MLVEELKEEISKCEELIVELYKHMSSHTERKQRLRQTLAEKLCPFTVGQEVKNWRGETEIIASIHYRPLEPFYKFKIRKIKKNREPYVNSQYASRPEKYTAVEG